MPLSSSHDDYSTPARGGGGDVNDPSSAQRQSARTPRSRKGQRKIQRRPVLVSSGEQPALRKIPRPWSGSSLTTASLQLAYPSRRTASIGSADQERTILRHGEAPTSFLSFQRPETSLRPNISPSSSIPVTRRVMLRPQLTALPSMAMASHFTPRRVGREPNPNSSTSTHYSGASSSKPIDHKAFTASFAVPELARAASPSQQPVPSLHLGSTHSLPSNKESEHINMTHGRPFIGRFRCAVSVVVRTPPAAASHVMPPQHPTVDTSDAHPSSRKGHDGGSKPTATIAADTLDEIDDDAPALEILSSSPTSPTIREQAGASSKFKELGNVGYIDADRRSPSVVNDSPLRPTSRAAASVTSAISGDSLGRGYRRGKPVSSLRSGSRSLARSISPAASPCLSFSTPRGGAPGGQPSALQQGFPSANMAPLVASGLHSSLWLAALDGGMEVRCVANPNQMLSSLPRRSPPAIITTLANVCNNRVVAGCADGSIRVYDAIRMQGQSEYRVHTAAITCVLYIPSAPRLPAPLAAKQASDAPGVAPMRSLLLAGSLDRSLTVWDATTMMLLYQLKDSLRGISALAATATGGYAISGAEDGTLRLWDVVLGKELTAGTHERALLCEGNAAEGALAVTGVPPVPGEGVTSQRSLSHPCFTSRETELKKDTFRRKRASGTTTSLLPGSSHRSLLAAPASVSVRSRSAAASAYRRLTFEHDDPAKRGTHAVHIPHEGKATLHVTRGTYCLTNSTIRHGRSRAASMPLVTFPTSTLADEDALFVPIEAETISNSLQEDYVLVGPGGDVSPLRYPAESTNGGSVNGVELEALGKSRGAASDVEQRSTKLRTPRNLKREGKVRPKGSYTKATATTEPKTATVTRKGSCVKHSAKRRKSSSKKGKVNTAETKPAVDEPTAEPTRLCASAQGRRWEPWLHHYQQRVLLSFESEQIMGSMGERYDAAGLTGWPIERAHAEHVSALAVVEDRLLVSASHDATAKVFALPSGRFVRSLASSSRRMPLSGLFYDSSVTQLYTAFADGGMAVYDFGHGELPLLLQLPSPHTMLSAKFSEHRVVPMRRFFWVANDTTLPDDSPKPAATEGLIQTAASHDEIAGLVWGVAQFDKNTMEDGPHSKATSYHVGQPSQHELNAAVSLQALQKRRARNLTVQAGCFAKLSPERREATEKYRCSRVIDEGRERLMALTSFVRWRRWARRHAWSLFCKRVVVVRAENCTFALLGRYLMDWRTWTLIRREAVAADVLSEVQQRVSGAAKINGHQEMAMPHLQRSWELAARTMAADHCRHTLRCAYEHWRDFQRTRASLQQRCVAYNRLLLSMNSSAYTPISCTLTYLAQTATREANRLRALWLVGEKTLCSQHHSLRRHCFDKWQSFAALHRQTTTSTVMGKAWTAVETPSVTLIQPQLLRRRYFGLWQDFALYVAHSDRLASERETLQMEWASLKTTLETPATVTELQQKIRVGEDAIRITKEHAQQLNTNLIQATAEVAALRTGEALNLLIAGYRVPSAVCAAAAMPLVFSSASYAYDMSSSAVSQHLRSSVTSHTSAVHSTGGGKAGRVMTSSHTSSGCIIDADATEAVRPPPLDDDDRLLFEASAVLRALKGSALHYAKDDKMLQAAHALALRLQVQDVVPSGVVSLDASRSRHSHQTTSQLRTSCRFSSWSESNAKSGGLTVLPPHYGAHSTLPPPSPSQLGRPSASTGGSANASLSGDFSPRKTAGTPRTPLTTNRGSSTTTSAAAMWAAQPSQESYTSLADAFDAVFANLCALLHAAALECGAMNDTGRIGVSQVGIDPSLLPSLTKKGASDAEQYTEISRSVFQPSWIGQVPVKQRRAMLGEVLKLVTLFDSFIAHNDLPIQCAGSISTRGAASTRPLLLSSLCSRDTAISLPEYAAVLLQLVDPKLWPRQLKLSQLQEGYAAAIAELNAAVSSPEYSYPAYDSMDFSAERSISLASALPARQPHTLCLSSEVLQEAGAALLPQEARVPAVVCSTGPLSTGQRTARSTSSVLSGSVQAMPRFTSSDSYAPARVHSADEPLSSTVRSLADDSTAMVPGTVHPRVQSFSNRTFSGVSTPRSYTPRITTSPSATVGRNGLVKAYLGFRVTVRNDSQASRRTVVISICEVTPTYLNTEGEEVEGPAHAAGLEVGDRLVRFAGYAVTDLAAFKAVASRHGHVGSALPIVVLRNGELLSKTIVVGARMGAGVA